MATNDFNNDIYIQLTLARYEFSKQNYNNSKEILNQIIKRSPSEGLAYWVLSQNYLAECNLDSARQTIPLAISLLNTKQSNAYNLLSEILIEENKLDTAKLLVRSNLNRYPADLQTHITALKLYNLTQFDEYQKELDKIRLLYSDDNLLQSKLLTSSFTKLSNCKEPIKNTSSNQNNPELSHLIDSLLTIEPDNNALLVIKDFILGNSTSQQDSSLQPTPLTETTQNTTAPSSKKEAVTSHSRLLQYLVHWKTQPADFFKKYNSSSFLTEDSARYIEDWFDSDSIHHTQSMYFDNNGLWKMIALLERPENSTQDLLGLVLKERAREAGDPIPTDASICPGFKNFNGYLWQHLDMIELVAQFSGKENQVRLLRIDPLRYPDAVSVCSYLKEILPNTTN